MERSPEISVIIPVYNVEKYLAQCLDSVIHQTLKDIQIICVDDGSPDCSIDILKAYADRDERIEIIRRENGGLSAARNTGLDRAKGKYVYFLDSDDMIADGALHRMLERAERDALDVLYFDAKPVYENEIMRERYKKLGESSGRSGDYPGVMTSARMFAAMLAQGDYRVQTQRQLFRLGFLREAGVSFCKGILHEDELFTFLTALEAKRVGYLKEVFFLRRVRENSIMTSGYMHNNFKGYLIGYREMLRYAMAHTFEPEADKAVWAHIVKQRDTALRVYWALDDEQRRGVDWTDDPFTHALLAMSEYEALQGKKADIARLKGMLADRKRTLERIGAELKEARRFPLMRLWLKLRRMRAKNKKNDEQ